MIQGYCTTCCHRGREWDEDFQVVYVCLLEELDDEEWTEDWGNTAVCPHWGEDLFPEIW